MPTVGYRVHPRFAEAWKNMPQQVFGRVHKVLERIRRDPDQVHHDKGCKRVKGLPGQIFEYRVNQDWRVTFTLQPNREPYLLLVGSHDKIFEGTRRMLEGAGIDLDETPAPLPRHHRQPQGHAPGVAAMTPAGPFSKLPDELLGFWGVPRSHFALLKALPNGEQALEVDGLTSETKECILDFLVGGTIRRPGTPDELTLTDVLVDQVRAARGPRSQSEGATQITREMLIELGTPEKVIPAILNARSWAEIEELAIPVRVTQRLLEVHAASAVTGVAPEHTRDSFAEDENVVADYYRGEIKNLLLFLAPEQRPLVDLPYGSVQFVKGVAGSGKTTVAIYRARRLVRERPDATVLMVTYNKSLARTARELAEAILKPAEYDRVTVTHFHKWMADFLGPERPTVVKDSERIQLITRAIEQVAASSKSKLLERPAAWFVDEISTTIKGRGLGTFSEYVAAERIGRATALAEPARRVVWAVYERYQAQLGARGDWDDYPTKCLGKLARADSPKKYDYVIVDEAQDLPPTALRLAMQLSAGSEPSAFVVADAAQSIYRRGFRWKDIGVTMHGSRVHQLSHNYRNTLEILKAANALLEGHPELRDDGESVSVCPTTPRRGPLPMLALVDGLKDEARHISHVIERLHREKLVPYGSMAVLAARNDRLDYVGSILRKSRIPVQMHRDPEFSLGSDRVKLLTLHSAKGLEFPVVFIADLNRGVIPRLVEGDPEAQRDQEDIARKLLYVGMTRAMQELILTASERKATDLVLGLPPEAVVRQRVRAEPVGG